jgi:hypothetical protein
MPKEPGVAFNRVSVNTGETPRFGNLTIKPSTAAASGLVGTLRTRPDLLTLTTLGYLLVRVLLEGKSWSLGRIPPEHQVILRRC